MSLGLSVTGADDFTVTCWSADEIKKLKRKLKKCIMIVNGYKDEASMLAGKNPNAKREYNLNVDKCDFDSDGYPILGTNTGVYAYLKTLDEWETATDIGE